MAIPVRYFRTSLTGGTDFCLDNIDGSRLNNGDTAIVVASGVSYEYWLNASSGATENSPLVITPDTNSGNKRWLLVDITANNYSGRNAIINGDFNIWQRGTSFAAIVNNAYAVDRFQYGLSGAAVHTLSQDTDVPTQVQSGHKSNYSLKVDCTTVDASIAAADYVMIIQNIEGYNFAPFMGKTATLSFWVKATKTGIYCVSFVNSALDRSYIVEYTIYTTNTWEKKTITLTFSDSAGTWNYTTGIGLRLFWQLVTGSNHQGASNVWNTTSVWATSNQVNACDSTDNNFWLSQVQFELGSVATPFEYEQFGDTLVKCQRYYEKSYNHADAPATSTENGAIQFTDPLAAGENFLRYCVAKRAAPTMTGYSTTGAAAKFRDLTSGADFDIIFSDIGESGCHVSFATSGAADELKAYHYTASAES